MTRLLAFLLSLGLMVGSLNGCGYNLRGNTRPFFDEHQIRTLYVAPVRNNSYKAGIEITVYNALRKRIAQGGYVRFVDSAKDADAQMIAQVNDASYVPAGITRADQIAPLGSGPDTVQIASSYNVNLRVNFQLLDRNQKVLWGNDLARAKSFPASTYFGALGSTSALINESEFERTLNDLSVSIVADAEESINSIF
jgi:hypothetical protein